MTLMRCVGWALACAGLGVFLAGPVLAQASAPHGGEPTTPIEHFVVLMQEGHSFDNYFGTYPGADGLPPNTCLPADISASNTAECIAPFRIGTSSTAFLAHSAATFQAQYNHGQMNGFVDALRRRHQDGVLAMGYYDDTDLPYYWNLADDYVLFDRFFSSAVGGGIWNRMFWIAGAPGASTEQIPAQGFGALPTIFDLLEQRGISWKFYVQHYDPRLTYRALPHTPAAALQVARVPLLAYDRFIDDPRLFRHIVDLTQYYEDLNNGTLPAVAYIATSVASEQAPSNIQAGQQLVRNLVNALMRSPAWSSSAFLITYDNWGGWYDHVAPPQVDTYGYGFRVPALLVSPYARQGYIDSTPLDFTAILKFIEDNYGLPPLSQRDAQAGRLAGAFDFTQLPRPARMLTSARFVAAPAPPRRDIIYACYGGLMVVAGLIIVGAVLGAQIRRAPLPQEGTHQ